VEGTNASPSAPTTSGALMWQPRQRHRVDAGLVAGRDASSERGAVDRATRRRVDLDRVAGRLVLVGQPLDPASAASRCAGATIGNNCTRAISSRGACSTNESAVRPWGRRGRRSPSDDPSAVVVGLRQAGVEWRLVMAVLSTFKFC
jgi:hypothetical protein